MQIFERLKQLDFLLTHKQMIFLTSQITGKEDEDFLRQMCEQGELYREKIWGLYLYAKSRDKLDQNRARQGDAFLKIIEDGFILSDRWLVNRLVKYTAQRNRWQLDRSAVQVLLCDLVVGGKVTRIGAISGKGTPYNCTYPTSKDSLFRSAVDYVFSVARSEGCIHPNDLILLKQQLEEYGKNWELFVLDHLVYLGELKRLVGEARYVIPG
jgi:hypothetical protein